MTEQFKSFSEFLSKVDVVCELYDLTSGFQAMKLVETSRKSLDELIKEGEDKLDKDCDGMI